MAIAANLSVALALNSARYRRGLDQARQRTQNFSRNANRQLEQTRRSFVALGAAAAAFLSGQALTGIFNTTARFEDLQTQLNATTGSVENGQAAFALISEFATRSQFSIEQLTASFSELSGAGIMPTEALLRTFADTAAITGDQIGTLQALTSLFSRTTSGGLGLEELNRLADRGVPVFAILEQQIGLTRLEISEFGQSAEGARAITEALINGLNQRFGGSSLEILENLSVAASNLGIAFRNLQNSVGEIMRPMVLGGFNVLIGIIQRLADNSDLLRRILNGVLGAFSALIGGALARGLVQIIRLVRSIGLAAAATQLVVAAIPVLVIGAGAAFGAFFSEITALGSAFFNFMSARFNDFRTDVSVVGASLRVTFTQAFTTFLRTAIDAFAVLRRETGLIPDTFSVVFANVRILALRAFSELPNIFIRSINAITGAISNSGIGRLLGIEFGAIDELDLFAGTIANIEMARDATQAYIDTTRTAGIVNSMFGESFNQDALQNYNATLLAAMMATSATATAQAQLGAAFTNLTDAVAETAAGISEVFFPTIDTTIDAVDDLGRGIVSTETTVTNLGAAAIQTANELAALGNSIQALLARLFPAREAARRFAEEQELLQQAFREGILTAEQLAEALRELETAYNASMAAAAGAAAAMPRTVAAPDTSGVAEAISEPIMEAAEETERTINDLERSLSDNFAGILRGAQSFSQGFTGVLDTIADSILNNFAMQAVSGLFGGFGGFNLFAGLFQEGGRIPAGQFGIVGEAGPEIVRGPANVTSAEDTAAALRGSGGDTVVNFNITGDVSTQTIRVIEENAIRISSLVEQQFQDRGVFA